MDLGLTDNSRYDSHELLVEYEWGPVHRLGLEGPVTFYSGRRRNDTQRPKKRLDGLKTTFQYSFYVSEEHQTSLAFGYINEIPLTYFTALGRRVVTGNGYSPLLVGPASGVAMGTRCLTPPPLGAVGGISGAPRA